MPYLSADERRTKIIDAAIEVIAAEGLAKATTRRIAERADAPLGALHYCFRNKRELILLVADRAASTISSAFERVDPARGVEQTIRDCIDCFWTWMRDNPGLQLACMELLMQAIRELDDDDDGLYARVYDPGEPPSSVGTSPRRASRRASTSPSPSTRSSASSSTGSMG